MSSEMKPATTKAQKRREKWDKKLERNNVRMMAGIEHAKYMNKNMLQNYTWYFFKYNSYQNIER